MNEKKKPPNRKLECRTTPDGCDISLMNMRLSTTFVLVFSSAAALSCSSPRGRPLFPDKTIRLPVLDRYPGCVNSSECCLYNGCFLSVYPSFPMSQYPTVPVPAAAAAVVLNTVLFAVVVPIAALILLTLAVRNGFARHPPSSYAFLASLVVVSVLAGAFSSHTRAEAIVQALLSLFRKSDIHFIDKS